MMRRFGIAAIGLAVFIVGCGGGKSINGKWNMDSGGSLPAGSTVKAEFSGSDAMVMNLEIKQPLPDGKTTITLMGEVKGTYKIEGEKMTMKADSVKFTGKDFPPELKSALEGSLGSMGDDVKKKINEEGVTKFAWVDDNKFTLTGKSGKAETYTRAN